MCWWYRGKVHVLRSVQNVTSCDIMLHLDCEIGAIWGRVVRCTCFVFINDYTCQCMTLQLVQSINHIRSVLFSLACDVAVFFAYLPT